MSERTLRLLSTHGAAEYLGVGIRTIERFKQEARFGFPQPTKIKGTNYWTAEDLDKFKEHAAKIRRRLQPLELLLEMEA